MERDCYFLSPPRATEIAVCRLPADERLVNVRRAEAAVDPAAVLYRRPGFLAFSPGQVSGITAGAEKDNEWRISGKTEPVIRGLSRWRCTLVFGG